MGDTTPAASAPRGSMACCPDGELRSAPPSPGSGSWDQRMWVHRDGSILCAYGASTRRNRTWSGFGVKSALDGIYARVWCVLWTWRIIWLVVGFGCFAIVVPQLSLSENALYQYIWFYLI